MKISQGFIIIIVAIQPLKAWFKAFTPRICFWRKRGYD